MSGLSVPVLVESGFLRYVQEIKRFPMLEPQEEYALAKAWVDTGDIKSAHRLVTSHLKLVVKIASGFRGYGLPMVELVSEGNIGLMQAVKRFNPELGHRLSTYAMWWIKAAIQDYVLRSWSLVKLGTTAAQKKLFFNLRKVQRQLRQIHGAGESFSLMSDEVKMIAKELNVTENEVIEMDQRMSGGDMSLNNPVHMADGEGGSELIDFIPDNYNYEQLYVDKQEKLFRKKLFKKALSSLNPREWKILQARRLRDVPSTLEELSQEFGISRERVRQIEVRAVEKLQHAVQAQGGS
jgi:RNA polymerase sigma-32 factor